MGYRIAIDVGGTFTDLVYLKDGDEIQIVKTPTTANQEIGVKNGLDRIADAESISTQDLLKQTEIIIHGTTVATNTMLEFTGSKTGLITTRGFRDDIEIRRGYKERIFNPAFPPPVPIARRRNRLTVDERIDRHGEIIKDLNISEVEDAVRKLKDSAVESIGVCLYFGFLNPVHENRISDVIKRIYPEAFISLSHEVLPQIREFERVSTTLVNAYTGPKLSRYLSRLESEFIQLGFNSRFFVMLSNGGMMNSDYAGKFAVSSLLSGPAGGVVACLQMLAEPGTEPNIITMDMGGTSNDVSLIKNKKPTITTDYWYSRYRVAVPMLDIHTIGAGGGSIAWIDNGGALHVGPQSAGATPGPACYGKGGIRPTVTDANLFLGFLDPDYFLGGEMKLDSEASRNPIKTHVADPLNISPLEAANGIFKIVNNNMTNGIRVVSVQKGMDPRDFTLVAFGGNGAVHAGRQAAELGIKKVIVPRLATALSAWGMLRSNIVVNQLRTYIASSDKYDLSYINSLFDDMKKGANKAFSKDKTISPGSADVTYNFYVDMHYKGETHEITVSLPATGGEVTAGDIQKAIAFFHQEHEKLHTFSNPEAVLFFMNFKLEMIVHTPKPILDPLPLSEAGASHAIKNRRPVYFEEKNDFIDTVIYNGPQVNCGNIMHGPCVIEEPATTIVVYPKQSARLMPQDYYEIIINEI
jgi:N-methylhydantoinase A